MPAAPSIDNYYIGKGRVFWTPEAGVERDLGNVPEFEFTPELEKLAHYSSRSGVRTKDREVVIEKSATLRIVMEEWSVENLALQLMGDTPADNGSGDMEFDLLAEDEIRGQIRFVGANSVGPQVTITLPLVSFIPSSAISLIGDEWGTLELAGEVLTSAGSFGTVTVKEPA